MEPDTYTGTMLKLMAKDNCKRLMTLSQCSLRLQHRLYDLYPDISDKLKAKTCVADVPQPLLAGEPRHKTNDRLKFFFVGRDFVRKGVPETIKALYRLRRKRRDFELTVITQVENTYNYAFKDFQDTQEEIAQVMKIIEDSKDWLTLYPNLPFPKVKEIMVGCDVGLLPTWAESYGYSTLEMEAAGLPCVTTNIRALPETNPCGWMIELPLNYAGEVALANVEQKMCLRKTLEERLYEIFDSICDNRNMITDKSEAAWNFIKTRHSPDKYAEFINGIYSQFGT